MPPVLEQSTYNTVAKYQSRTCTATFTRPTTPGSLIVVVCAAAGTLPSRLTTPSGFTELGSAGLRDMQMTVWYRQASPSITSVSVTALDDNKSLQLRALEYSGMAQADVVDKLIVRSGESQLAFSGSTGTTSQGDELVLGFVANQYASTAQFGFSGSLARLFESTSPQNWSRGWNEDWERSRLSVHQAIATSTGSFSLNTILSSTRRWMALLVTLRGGSTGPARFTSRNAPPALQTSGRGSLTVFGPLASKTAPPVLQTSGGSARISPFNYQFRLGGWTGLLIGAGTPYTVESHDGLYGYQVRSSDEDQPREAGSLRGIDLQSARQVLLKVHVYDGDRDEVERRLDELYRALVPRRDTDQELIWRHPAQSPRMLRYRPIELPREVDALGTILARQPVMLRCADPRHYSAVPHTVEIPVTPGTGDPVMTQVVNLGNIAAYPVITIEGPTSGPPVSRIELVNVSALVTFDVQVTLPSGSVLVGDMDARVTGAPRSIVTLDGQSKYGSWQLPRDPFHINPDPSGHGGYNLIYLRTTPAGAPVRCTLSYRDTWSG
ncbi:hypothetical protein ACFQE5_22360 [Pseudonocardia hispaniensis]|uniref:Phage tail protein n=1 Tax=Pseudonocardia hispaniensis TaxID=904933 RepID=A0ABW1J7U6_9PSEU